MPSYSNARFWLTIGQKKGMKVVQTFAPHRLMTGLLLLLSFPFHLLSPFPEPSLLGKCSRNTRENTSATREKNIDMKQPRPNVHSSLSTRDQKEVLDLPFSSLWKPSPSFVFHSIAFSKMFLIQFLDEIGQRVRKGLNFLGLESYKRQKRGEKKQSPLTMVMRKSDLSHCQPSCPFRHCNATKELLSFPTKCLLLLIRLSQVVPDLGIGWEREEKQSFMAIIKKLF